MREKTLRDYLNSAGVYINGINIPGQFKIDKQEYALNFRKEQWSKPHFIVNTKTRTIDIVNAKDADEISYMLFSALLQYTPYYSENTFWRQLREAVKKKEDAQIREAA